MITCCVLCHIRVLERTRQEIDAGLTVGGRLAILTPSCMQSSETKVTMNIGIVLLGASLLVVTSVAIAGPASPGKAAALSGYSECEGASKGASKRTTTPQKTNGVSSSVLVQDTAREAQDRAIGEYLSFHARVTEDNGKFTLMPWSGLRTHAN